MVTMKDIAARAGVSVATVSYCINNTKSVKPATRDRIMQAVQELGYIPNDSAQTLRSRSTQEFGVVFPDIDDLGESEILKGIAAAAEAQDYSLQIALSTSTPKLEQKIIERFLRKQVEGLIILTCQPENTDFFRNTVGVSNVPTVFIDRMPEKIDANFLGFDTYRVCLQLTARLIDAGYRRIALVAGHRRFFSEMESIRGYTDAMDERHMPPGAVQIVETDLTKEAAFRQAMFHLADDPPQAVITTSNPLSLGVMEAFNLTAVDVPGRTCVITLGADCWNRSNYLPNVIHTAQAAYALGQHCVELLLKNRKSPQFFEKEFLLFPDNVDDLALPPAPALTAPAPARDRLRLLVPSLPTVDAMQAIAREFELAHNLRLEVDCVSYHELFEAITRLADTGEGAYDLYLFDVSWLEYVARRGVFLDLTDFLQQHETLRHSLLWRNLQNCCFDGRCCGFPLVGGSHMLFYRRDLFDNPFVRRQFEAMYNAPLQVPRTWTEFNAVARFFTREHNPYSPTACGTTVIGSIHEDCALEILTRLWSYGGDLFDENGRPCLNSPQNIKGLQSLLETCRYAKRGIAAMTIEESFRAFGAGETAMLLSFTEYASLIRSNVEGSIISRIDCAMLPGRTPVNVGWNLGIAKSTPHQALAQEFLTWLCHRRTSYYMTILNGQSVVTYPHQNHELRKLFPWLALVEEGQSRSRSRRYPIVGRSRWITPAETEMILYRMFHRLLSGKLTVWEAAEQGQAALLRLLQ
ncbi:MAG: extracellular solute-binding protein [Oscillospiraceae bacterium]|nr:extracellular solute-binding protein [Oscillospiraceae bacterium]